DFPRLGRLLRGPRRPPLAPAAQVSKQQVRPAVAIPVHNTRFYPDAPVGGTAGLVVAPRRRTRRDEQARRGEPRLSRRALVAIPDDTSVAGPDDQVRFAVAVPVRNDRGCVAL